MDLVKLKNFFRFILDGLQVWKVYYKTFTIKVICRISRVGQPQRVAPVRDPQGLCPAESLHWKKRHVSGEGARHEWGSCT